MEAGKTGALLSCASSIGALLAGAPSQSVAALCTFGMELGLAFQAVDDVLGIWGDPLTTGKPAFSDLHQHKKTLPVAAALAAGGPFTEELATLVATPELTEAEVARAAELVEACGGREVAAGEARRRLAGALAALEGADLEAGPREELGEVAAFVVDRQH
jgi:geranylgeranyl diphosphate synthase type I